ncbi:hypothetical protein SNEBB_001568 [Seison nebaliae]|nr:hypothetical protein SNEBB_001568 [Seison nebaliae]
MDQQYNPSMSIPNNEGSKTLRDPFDTPSSILNIDGNCLSISTLQLLMASPSLMFLFYEHNYCSTFTCFQLQLHIAKNKEGKCNLIKDIEYSYLVHEVMVMMGFRTSENEMKGHSCKNHPISTGCRMLKNYTSHLDTVNGSLVLHNFYHLYTMRENQMIAKGEIQQSSALNSPELLSRIGTKSVRGKFLNSTDNDIKDLRLKDDNIRKGVFYSVSSFLGKTKNNYEYCKEGLNSAVDSQRYSKLLNLRFKTTVIFFINFLFIGLGGTRQTETVAHIFYKDTQRPFFLKSEVKELVYKTLWPSWNQLIMDHVTYFPHLKMIYLKMDQKKDETKVIFDVYPFCWLQTWNDDIFNMVSPQLSLLILRKLLSQLLSLQFLHCKFRLNVNGERIFTPNRKVVNITYRDIGFTFPIEFWCDNIPCNRKLFKHHVIGSENEEFELFGMHLRHYVVEHRISMYVDSLMIQNAFYEEYKLKRSRKIFKWMMNRKSLFDVLAKLDKNTTAHVISELQKYIEVMVYKETVQNLEKIKNKGDISFPLPPSMVIRGKSESGHSLALVKSFNSNWWFINNEEVEKVENPKEFFNNLDIKTSMNAKVTFWQRVKNSRSTLNNLRAIIHPITENDLFNS